MANQNEIIKDNIKDFFKNIKQENFVLLDIVQQRDELKNKYTTESLRLNMKKEKLWNQGDITKWEMDEEGERMDRNILLRDKIFSFKKMCAKETKQLNNTQQKMGYYNKLCMDQMKTVIKSQCKRFSANMKSFVETFYPTLTDVLIIIYFSR
jgi:hypothetical protein